MNLRPLIYIAGGFSADPVAGTRAAIEAGDACWDAGGCPVIPHLNLLWDLHRPAPVETWYERDLHLLARCDALIRLQGESLGSDAEVAFAREHSIPVYVVSCEPMLYVQSATMRVLETWEPPDRWAERAWLAMMEDR
jgi:hypothetical protein